MTKGIGLIALCLTLEAAFLFQVSVIAPPAPRAVAIPASTVAVTEADGETIVRAAPVSLLTRGP